MGSSPGGSKDSNPNKKIDGEQDESTVNTEASVEAGEETETNPEPRTSRNSRRRRRTQSTDPVPSTSGLNRPGTPSPSPSRHVRQQIILEETSANPEPSTSKNPRRRSRAEYIDPGPSTSGLNRPDTPSPSPSRHVRQQIILEETAANSEPSTSKNPRRGSRAESIDPGPSISGLLNRPGTRSPSLSRMVMIKNEHLRQTKLEKSSTNPEPSTSRNLKRRIRAESIDPGPSTSGLNRPGTPSPSPSREGMAGNEPSSEQIENFIERCDPELPPGVPLALIKKIMEEGSTRIGSRNIVDASSYQYRDSEDLMTELAELYSYSEDETYYTYRAAFENRLTEFGAPLNWNQLSDDQRAKIVMRLMSELQADNQGTVLTAVRALLYIAQGTWGELSTEEAHREALRSNAIFLYRVGVFDGLISIVKKESKRFRYASRTNSESFRVMMATLNILCTITEVIRHENDTLNTPYTDEIEDFRSDMLAEVDGELFIISLFKMIARYSDCDVQLEGFPIKKMLLLLWKIMLVTLGGLKELEEKKRLKRIQYGLKPDHNWPESSDNVGSNTPEHGSVSPRKRPKVYKQDFEQFLKSTKRKYPLSTTNDRTEPVLPQIVRRNIEVVSKYVYIPLSERQVQEDRANRLVKKNCPTKNSDGNEETAIETFYRAMYKKFDQFLLSLIKILSLIFYKKHRKIFTCKPNIAGVERITNDANSTYNTIVVMDARRYQAIMLKAISAILLLLLKHLKLNHIYQFEHMCRQLDGYNTLTLLMGFFRRDLSQYITEINDVTDLSFPYNVLRNRENSITYQHQGHTQASSRHMFICINLMRIINKQVKWKYFRLTEIMNIDSKTPLEQCININNNMFKMYALKLLKMQLKYLGFKWWSKHMNVVSEIYSHVRLNLIDDYLKGRIFPVGIEEPELDQLISAINGYIIPRYGDPFEISPDEDPDELNVDNCLIEFSVEDPESWNLSECLLSALFRWMRREFLS